MMFLYINAESVCVCVHFWYSLYLLSHLLWEC